MVLSINKIELTLSIGLISFDHFKDVLLKLGIGNSVLEWTLISSKSSLDRLCKLRNIDDLTICALLYDSGDERFSTKRRSNNNSPFSLVSKMLIEGALIPAVHSLQTMFLLEKGINRLSADTIINDLNLSASITASSKNDGSKFRTVTLEDVSLLDGLGEVREDELVTSFDTRVDDLLQHVDDKLVSAISGLLSFFDLVAKLSVSSLLLLDEVEHGELNEALVSLELGDDLISLGLGIR